jgi:hypothetical protein
MRGDDNLQEGIFSYISPEKRVPADHPLRPIRKMVDEILKEMSPQFAKLYSNALRGQSSITSGWPTIHQLACFVIPAAFSLVIRRSANFRTFIDLSCSGS